MINWNGTGFETKKFNYAVGDYPLINIRAQRASDYLPYDFYVLHEDPYVQPFPFL